MQKVSVDVLCWQSIDALDPWILLQVPCLQLFDFNIQVLEMSELADALIRGPIIAYIERVGLQFESGQTREVFYESHV